MVTTLLFIADLRRGGLRDAARRQPALLRDRRTYALTLALRRWRCASWARWQAQAYVQLVVRPADDHGARLRDRRACAPASCCSTRSRCSPRPCSCRAAAALSLAGLATVLYGGAAAGGAHGAGHAAGARRRARCCRPARSSTRSSCSASPASTVALLGTLPRREPAARRPAAAARRRSRWPTCAS